MNSKDLTITLTLAQRYVDAIDLGNVYGVAVLTKGKRCHMNKPSDKHMRLAPRHINAFGHELAFQLVENATANPGFYWEVKEAYQKLEEDEAMIVVFGSISGDVDHFFKGDARELEDAVNGDYWGDEE